MSRLRGCRVISPRHLHGSGLRAALCHPLCVCAPGVCARAYRSRRAPIYRTALSALSSYIVIVNVINYISGTARGLRLGFHGGPRSRLCAYRCASVACVAALAARGRVYGIRRSALTGYFLVVPGGGRGGGAEQHDFTTDHYRPANQAIRRRAVCTVALTAAQSTPSSAVSLQADLRAAPVATLRVIPDLVVRAHANPLRDRPVLLQLLGQRLLDAESLVARHGAAQGKVHVSRRWRLDPKGLFGREGHVRDEVDANPCYPPLPPPLALCMRDRIRRASGTAACCVAQDL